MRIAAGSLFAASSLGLVAITVFNLQGALGGGTPCPFKFATGLRCPLCGMTRATFKMLHGDLAGALQVHPLAPLLFLLLVGGMMAWLLLVATGRAPPLRARPPLWAGIAFVAAVWTVNLLFGTG